MSNCKRKPKNTCGDRKSNARCVFYDLPIPEFSKLEDDCVTIEETTEDLYKLAEWLKESIDLEDLDPSCLTLEKVNDKYYGNKVKRYLVKDVLKELIQKNCNESVKGDTNNINWVLENLDYKCLVFPCGPKPGSLLEFFQLLINKTCQDE